MNAKYEFRKQKPKNGKWPYVFQFGVVLWGLPMFVLYNFVISSEPIKPSSWFYSETSRYPISWIAFQLALWCLGGLLVGLVSWRKNEREHEKNAPEWDRLNDEVGSLWQQGHVEHATVVAKEALQVAEKKLGIDHPSLAVSLNNLALLYKDQSHYAQAEPLFQRLLAILEKALGPEHPAVATILEQMAAIYKETGRSEAADELEKRSASMRKKSGEVTFAVNKAR